MMWCVNNLPKKKKTVLVTGVGRWAHERLEFALLDRGYDMVALLADDAGMEFAEKFKESYQATGKKFLIKKIDSEDYLSILNTTLLLLQNECKGYTPEFYVGLSTRFVTLALSQAATITDSVMFLVTIENYDKPIPKDLREIPRLPTLTLSLPQIKALDVLIKNGGSVGSLKDMDRLWRDEMEIAQIERTSNVSKLTKKLESWGLVERKTSPESERVREIYITELGRTVREWKKIRRSESKS
jgi:DNA-binding MarR family transcriptional regulator